MCANVARGKYAQLLPQVNVLSMFTAAALTTAMAVIETTITPMTVHIFQKLNKKHTKIMQK